jgi:hypothetical protein
MNEGSYTVVTDIRECNTKSSANQFQSILEQGKTFSKNHSFFDRHVGDKGISFKHFNCNTYGGGI